MARIGYKKGKYNTIDTSTNKYTTLGSNGKVPCLEKVIDETFEPEFNAVELYADDLLAESDYSFKKGTLTITVANDNDETEAKLMGNLIGTSTNEGEVTKKVYDNAPECGYGHIVTKMVNGVKQYKVEFFPRIKFTKIKTDAKTRGESVEFGTTSMEATVFPLDVEVNGMEIGTWEKHKTFDKESEAETYLDACLTPSA